MSGFVSIFVLRDLPVVKMSGYKPHVSYDIKRYANHGPKVSKIADNEVNDDEGYLHSEKKEWNYRPGVRMSFSYTLIIVFKICVTIKFWNSNSARLLS